MQNTFPGNGKSSIRASHNTIDREAVHFIFQFFWAKNIGCYFPALCQSQGDTRHVKEYQRGEGGTVIMSNDAEIEVNRRKKEQFLLKIKEIYRY